MSLLLSAGAAVTAIAAVGLAPVVGAVPQPPQGSCTSELYEWSGDQLLVPWQPTFQAGEIPGPAIGETLVLTGVQYSAWDEYPEGTVPSRADADQPDESFGITIGGVPVGGLSADLPDTLPEGAPTIWYSGVHSGSLGGAGTEIDGGIILVRHASLYGVGAEPANSVHASGLTITVDRCVAPPEETTTTPAPTTTAGPTTTAAPTTEAPTTTAESAGPTAAPTTAAPATTPTARVASAATLPATGRGSATLLLVASLCGAVGAALLIVRRRPVSAAE
jgi:LPXTG-motif cell wall-anchored protein